MPANPASLRVTEAYRSRMVALRKRAQADARQAWRQIDPADLSGTYPVGMLALTVETLQREAARLSCGYLKAFIDSELGVTDTPIPLVDATMVGDARNGDNLRTALMSPLIGVKAGIRDGKSPEQALAEGRSALERMVGLATDTAARESLHRAMSAAPEVVGWQRAVGGTCGACMGDIKSEMVDTETPLRVHPNCKCVAEPAVDPFVQSAPPEDVLREAYRDLDREARTAVGDYVSTPQSFTINQYLRDPSSTAANIQERIEVYRRTVAGLDKAMEQAGPIGRTVRVFRGTAGSPADLGLPADPTGAVLVDRAFTSTTSERFMAEHSARRYRRAGKPATDIAGENMVWELDVHPSVRGLWGANPGERELLLQRECRYVVTSATKEGETWQIKARILPPAA